MYKFWEENSVASKKIKELGHLYSIIFLINGMVIFFLSDNEVSSINLMQLHKKYKSLL